MPFRGLFIAIAAVVMLTMGTAAWADSCFQDTGGRVLFVQSSTSVGKGKCRAILGYLSNQSFVLRGVVCRNTAGTTLRFGLDYSDSYVGILGTYAFALNRETLTGSGYIYTAGASSTGFSISKIDCPATVLQ